jgi:hypothetical protein
VISILFYRLDNITIQRPRFKMKVVSNLLHRY